jgi:hypothetical protein
MRTLSFERSAIVGCRKNALRSVGFKDSDKHGPECRAGRLKEINRTHSGTVGRCFFVLLRAFKRFEALRRVKSRLCYPLV